MPVASCHFTGYHWEEPDCIIFTSQHQIFIYIDETPLSLFFWSWIAEATRCVSDAPLPASPSWPFVGLTPACPCLLCQAKQNGTQHCKSLSPAVSRREESPPSTCWQCFCSWGPGCWPSLSQGHIASSFSLLVTRSPNTPPTVLLSLNLLRSVPSSRSWRY